MELNFGESDAALVIAVLETCTPLPAGLLKDIRAGADAWFSDDVRPLILDAITNQELQGAGDRG
ncbi:hypothetical protein LV457_16785 [Mycobacterium sp. MYCO198283]|uniref:hypothetical protein n=1 Tax=Mycobacterium sp. MYCO198283 TaxID=2883505 RepID=UPI001E32DBFE|nr:hypothetical protein [Mycobacterium sp. MYCO198283]MCG5433934.1 hypothetical protein [Mycobacterium sp. MYCO198283]